MRIRPLRASLGTTLVALAIAAVAGQPAMAASDTTRPGFYGVPAPAGAAARVIELERDARWINVTQNETVAIRRGDQVFTWTFTTWATNSFDLARIAPAGFVAPETVRVYLAPDPRYSGR